MLALALKFSHCLFKKISSLLVLSDCLQLQGLLVLINSFDISFNLLVLQVASELVFLLINSLDFFAILLKVILKEFLYDFIR